jgi:hypothetical protein
MAEVIPIDSSKRRNWALLKILACLVFYALVLFAALHGAETKQFSVRWAVGFMLTFSFVLFVVALFTTFKPFKK